MSDLREKRDAFVDALARAYAAASDPDPWRIAARALVAALDVPSVTMSMKSMMPPPPAPSEPSPEAPFDDGLCKGCGRPIEPPIERITHRAIVNCLKADLETEKCAHEEMKLRVEKVVEMLQEHRGKGDYGRHCMQCRILAILEGRTTR